MGWITFLLICVCVALVWLENKWDSKARQLENRISEMESSLLRLENAIEQLPDAFDIARAIRKNDSIGSVVEDSAIVDHPEWFTPPKS